jgi:magnesium transporter
MNALTGARTEPVLPALDAAAHPMESAVGRAVTRVPLAHEDERVDDVLVRLQQTEFDSVDAVYVVDAGGAFKGAAPLVELFGAPRGALLGDLMDVEYPRVGPLHDQEHAAAEALALHATTVAIVDDAGHLVGVVSARALIEILRHEHVEDIHRLAGVQRETAQNRSALEEPPARRARHRLPWLLVGLVGSMLSAVVVSRFEDVLQRSVAVAFFVPAIVYLADAIGTQTEAIVVRGLSLSRLSLRHLLFDELRTGLLIGLCLGTLAFPIVSLAFGVRLASAVTISIIVAGTMATTIGLLLPWLFQRLGADPALGSGPVATIIQDVLSLLIYFALASLLVGS